MSCQAIGCTRTAERGHLMCPRCWRLVPRHLAQAVLDAGRMRGEHVGATWAAWWRAQARAVAFVEHFRRPDHAKRDAYVQRADDFAFLLEHRPPSTALSDFFAGEDAPTEGSA